MNSSVIQPLQLSCLYSIEGLSQVAREQIRDRERMGTFSMHMGYRSNARVTVLVEAHFERLVMAGKGVHSRNVLLVSKFPGSKGSSVSFAQFDKASRVLQNSVKTNRALPSNISLLFLQILRELPDKCCQN